MKVLFFIKDYLDAHPKIKAAAFGLVVVVAGQVAQDILHWWSSIPVSP